MTNIANNLTNGELLFLSTFLVPRKIDDDLIFTQKEWKNILKDEPINKSKSLIEKGYIEECDIGVAAYIKLSKKEIDDFLKSQRLPTNGRKDENLCRALTVNIKGVENLLINSKIFTCSKLGLELIIKNQNSDISVDNINNREIIINIIKYFTMAITAGVGANFLTETIKKINEFEDSIQNTNKTLFYLPKEEYIDFKTFQNSLNIIKKEKDLKVFDTFFNHIEKLRKGERNAKSSVILFCGHTILFIESLRITRIFANMTFEDFMDIEFETLMNDSKLYLDKCIPILNEMSNNISFQSFPRLTSKKDELAYELISKLTELMNIAKKDDLRKWKSMKNSFLLKYSGAITDYIKYVYRVLDENSALVISKNLLNLISQVKSDEMIKVYIKKLLNN